MKKLFSLITLILCFVSFTAIPTRRVTASTTITAADNDGVVTNTGGAVTFTFGTVASGFSCTINNQGTGNVTFGSDIFVQNGKSINTLGWNSTQITPNGISNRIRIYYDGTVFRSF